MSIVCKGTYRQLVGTVSIVPRFGLVTCHLQLMKLEWRHVCMRKSPAGMKGTRGSGKDQGGRRSKLVVVNEPSDSIKKPEFS